jgi:hypothetical protein
VREVLRGVEAPGAVIVRFGGDPGEVAALRLAPRRERLHQLAGDAAALVRRVGAQIVDVEVRCAVRLQMHVAADVPDDDAFLNGDEQRMPLVRDIGARKAGWIS